MANQTDLVVAAPDGDTSSQTTRSKDFHHPYIPYTIQEDFMNTVYQVLEEGKVGILESPTGTGKSLSLICGALTWLREHTARTLEDGLSWDHDVSGEPAWFVAQARASRKRELLRTRRELEAKLGKIRAKEQAERDRMLHADNTIKRRKIQSHGQNGSGSAKSRDDDDEFVLDEYESGEDDSTRANKAKGRGEGFSATTMELLKKLGMMPDDKDDEDELDEETKIFYCSRTHSQLTQFINELRRPTFPAPAFDDDGDGKTVEETPHEPIKHLTLGSRKNLCINPAVNRLSSMTAINERCAELQQSSTPKDQRCPYLPSSEQKPLLTEFRDHALATIRDIEDMGQLGRDLGVCPYYASRSAIRAAEIVTLPYPLLLQESAREALAISVKNHVVIIDEAHNLMDAISGIYGTTITLEELKRARAQLGGYLLKFRNRLKGKNRVYVAQTVRIVDSLIAYLEPKAKGPAMDGVVSDKDLLSGKGVDQVNLYKLLTYLKDSKLARKVEGYATHVELQQSTAKTAAVSHAPVLHKVASILLALTHPSTEGRLFYAREVGSDASPGTSSMSLRFQLLDPSPHFEPILSSARAVVLAGGTMAPFSDYTTHLLPTMPPSRLTTLSCGHVIPAANLMAWTLSQGPSGTTFEFNHKNKDNVSIIDELGRALLNICALVPDGVVVFFSSYAYLEAVVARWSACTSAGSTTAAPTAMSNREPLQGQASGPPPGSLLARLSRRKEVFQESRTISSEHTLAAYAQAIDGGRGGLLLSVVGGKMSEGINFSDALGRCVLIVGLPYPNIASAEWRARMAFVGDRCVKRLTAELHASSSTPAESSTAPAPGASVMEAFRRRGKDEARDFYENACMRAVNQSIGRAIRHREDYAAIIMVDTRYQGERIRGKLPAWIRGGLVDGSGRNEFGALMARLGVFFRGKKGT